MSSRSVCRIGILFVAAMVAISLAASPSWAWNDAGHMVVARIAWLRLTESQREAVFTRMKTHPHFETSLISNRPSHATDSEWAFLRASTWSDYIRPPKSMSKEAVAKHPKHKFHRGVWHYVNFPYHAGQNESALAARGVAERNQHCCADRAEPRRAAWQNQTRRRSRRRSVGRGQ